METFSVHFRPSAADDLFELHDYITGEAGRRIADSYVDRIEELCRSLAVFPERGTRRDHILQGLRTVGFEKRATIVYRVTEAKVVILRIFYGGQDFEHKLRDMFEN